MRTERKLIGLTVLLSALLGAELALAVPEWGRAPYGRTAGRLGYGRRAAAEQSVYRRLVWIGAPNGARTVTVVPLEIIGSDPIFTRARADGADLRIMTNADVAIPFQLIEFSPSENYAFLLVKLDTSLTGQDTLNISYGDINASSVSQSVLTAPYFVDQFNWATQPAYRTNLFTASGNLGSMSRDNTVLSVLTTNPASYDSSIRENGNILLAPIGLIGSAVAADTFDMTWYTGKKSGQTYVIAAQRAQSLRGTGAVWTKIDTISSRQAEDPYVIHRNGRFEMYAEEKSSNPPWDQIGRWTCPDSIVPSKFTFDKIVIPAQPHLTWADNSPSSPALWHDTTNNIVFCFFEGKGTASCGGGCIGLAYWEEFEADTFLVATNPILQPTGSPDDFDYTGCVPDDILYKIQFFLLYHGINTSSNMGYAIADNILGVYERQTINPLEPMPTIMPFAITGGASYAGLGCDAASTRISTYHFIDSDTTAAPAPWTYMRRGTETFNNKTKMATPRCQTIGGNLLLSGDPGLASSGTIVSGLSFTNGMAMDIRYRLLNDLGTPYVSLGFGSDSLCDISDGTTNWYQTTSRTSYTALVHGYGTDQARLWSTPTTGSATALQTFTHADGDIDNYLRMTFAYTTAGDLMWLHNGGHKLYANHTTYLNNTKRARISVGSNTTVRGGTVDAKWAVVRPILTPHPRAILSAEIPIGKTLKYATFGGQGDTISIRDVTIYSSTSFRTKGFGGDTLCTVGWATAGNNFRTVLDVNTDSIAARIPSGATIAFAELIYYCHYVEGSQYGLTAVANLCSLEFTEGTGLGGAANGNACWDSAAAGVPWVGGNPYSANDSLLTATANNWYVINILPQFNAMRGAAKYSIALTDNKQTGGGVTQRFRFLSRQAAQQSKVWYIRVAYTD